MARARSTLPLGHGALCVTASDSQGRTVLVSVWLGVRRVMGYPSGWGKKLRGVQRFDFKFPDHAGKANSETLMVDPVSEDLFIVLKNVTRVLGRLPRTPQDSGASPGRAARSPFTHSSSAAREPRVWWGGKFQKRRRKLL